VDHTDIARSPELPELVARALAEDIGAGDATSEALVPDETTVSGTIVSRGTYVLAGLPVAEAVFRACDGACRFTRLAHDGQAVRSGAELLTIAGRARAILAAERTALNFLQRMTGIATLTRRFVAKVERHGAVVLDTRKTTPGLRFLEKYAVRCGGGTNHRMGLYDRVLVKDNHRRLWKGRGDLGAAVREARERFPGLAVEVEIESESDLREALSAAPDWVLLDNLGPGKLEQFVEMCRGCCRVEASGGITLDNVEAVAQTGVDAVSLGCLTHSAPAADLSLEMDG
jgi:nicotinate-nucleotide pyrophosphorylase (carboxylating)